jgi:hypothetical protein
VEAVTDYILGPRWANEATGYRRCLAFRPLHIPRRGSKLSAVVGPLRMGPWWSVGVRVLPSGERKLEKLGRRQQEAVK